MVRPILIWVDMGLFGKVRWGRRWWSLELAYPNLVSSYFCSIPGAISFLILCLLSKQDVNFILILYLKNNLLVASVDRP